MRSQRMLRLVRWLPLFALLAILGIGAVVVRLRGPFKEHLRRAVVWELSRSLGRPVGVKESRLSLVRPQGQNLLLRLSVSGLSVAQPAGFAKPGAADFLRIPELRLDFQPRGLFSSKGALSALRRAELRRPEIYLVRDRQGRWNFSELLARRPAKPSRFTGRVEVAGGRLRVQDFSPPSGLNIPQVNNLENLRFLTSSPQPGRFYFRLWGENPQRHLERIFAAGQWGAGALSSLRGSAFSAAGPAQQAAMAAAEGGLATHNSQARLSASVALTQVDLGYLWRYWSPVRGLKIATGRADVTGYFSSRQSEPGVDYAVAATASRAEVGLPWLRGQVKEARGLVRGGNGLLQFSRLEGRLEAAAITGDGYLLTFPRGTAGKPGASYAFQLHARNTGFYRADTGAVAGAGRGGDKYRGQGEKFRGLRRAFRSAVAG